MQVNINKIKIRKRIRKNAQNIDELANSINRFGLLHPITITRKNILVSGMRRLSAAKMLGWQTIEANIISEKDKAGMLELEIEENIQRNALSQEEIEAAFSRLDKLRNPNIFMRICLAIAKFFKKLFRINN